ncbi:MAG: biotin/lipoyl-containing protein [Candidatus Acidiferrum sp.]|jgi:acetyltransferase-like isoleucine patch superfamily enzyme
MANGTSVEIPLVNVNDETVRLIAWLVEDGDEVREGQNIAELETSKAVVELVAPASGRIRLAYLAGEELPVGAIVAHIGEQTAEDVPELVEAAAPGRAAASAGTSAALAHPCHEGLPEGSRFSKKARQLLELHGVAPGIFKNHGTVREQDVLEHLRHSKPALRDAAELHHALLGISLEGVTLPSISWDLDSGRMDPEFVEELRNRSEALANLPSDEKCQIYRRHGAHIGENVVIGKGTVLVAPRIHLGDGVRIGGDSSVILRERFAAGDLSSFREGLSIRGGTAIFGENVFAGGHIQIGGGGHSDPWAVLVVGDGAYLGDDIFVNICRPVLIGKEVFLTQRAILVTHNIGHSILEGFENVFAPIVLEDFAQVGMNSTLYAGARVGHSAIIASNSYVISSIPKGKLAMGVPAAVVRNAARTVDRKKQLQIAENMLRQFQELLKLKGLAVSPVEATPILQFRLSHQGKDFRIAFVESFSLSEPWLPSADEVVLWTLDSAAAVASPGVTLFDLLGKTVSGPRGLFADSAREFLRKRGIRFNPGPWRYQTGLV